MTLKFSGKFVYLKQLILLILDNQYSIIQHVQHEHIQHESGVAGQKKSPHQVLLPTLFLN